jgi:hypothetical protein
VQGQGENPGDLNGSQGDDGKIDPQQFGYAGNGLGDLG